MLKGGYHGTYHRTSTNRLQRYVSEFAGLNNIRDLDTITQMMLIVLGLVVKRLQHDELTDGSRPTPPKPPLGN